MNSQTRTALAELNRAFYARFAGDFARTRQSWPPGFARILPYLAPAFNVVDLGCGNGRLLHFLVEAGWSGRYLGVDSSAGLLAIARERALAQPGLITQFVEADLLNADWPRELAVPAPAAAAALAVLHHIPGAEARAAFLANAAELLPPGAALIVSTWQFLTAPRLAAHILPWSRVGLSAEDVEPGDYLLSWGQSAVGERYCAFIGEPELRRLAHAARLDVETAFFADGLEGNLNLYGVLRSR